MGHCHCHCHLDVIVIVIVLWMSLSLSSLRSSSFVRSIIFKVVFIFCVSMLSSFCLSDLSFCLSGHLYFVVNMCLGCLYFCANIVFCISGHLYFVVNMYLGCLHMLVQYPGVVSVSSVKR